MPILHLYTRVDAVHRYQRLKRLRAMNVTKWVIRWEQVALTCAKKAYGKTKIDTELEAQLIEKYVTPLMEQDERLSDGRDES